MRLHRLQFFVSLLISATTALPVAAQPKSPPPRSATAVAATDRARALHVEGARLFEAGKYEQAYVAFVAAWALKKHPQIAGNLADCEVKIGRYRDAAEHLAFVVRDPNHEAKPDEKRIAQERLVQVKAKIGTLTISASPEGTEIVIDGKLVGTSPLGEPIYVEPGSHVIEARKDGLPPGRRVIEAPPGSDQPVAFALAMTPPTGRMKPAIVISGSALAAVALGTGLGLFVAANGKKGDTDETRARLVELGGCPSAGAACQDLRDTLGSASTMHNVAVGAFISAGIIGAATATYAVIASRPRSDERRVGRVQIAPMFGSAGGGLLVGGTF